MTDAKKTAPGGAAAMMDEMRATLEQDEAEGKLAGLTVDRLQKAMAHPKAQAVVAELVALESEVVDAGEPAPDFTLPWLAASSAADGAPMTLSDHFGKRPVGLIFGSYT